MIDLARLSELETTCDGPIPQHLLDAARFGSAANAARAKANTAGQFFSARVRDQIIIIRQRRADGRFEQADAETLALYRSERRRVRRIAMGAAQ